MSIFALGIELDGEGSHPAAWRHAHHPPSESLSGRTLTQKVRAAENAGFTFATFDDSIVPPKAGVRGARRLPTERPAQGRQSRPYSA
jgi:alkanesulfonate monooxygenase SsuD/methylene tetrahydromethanopterin reductase-like flavin-dependent oxidoreductase (luciferase family)